MAHIHDVRDDDKHFSIVPSTRALESHVDGKLYVMQYDHNSERITFDLPTVVEGHNILDCDKIEVHYLNIDARTRKQKDGLYEVDDLQLSPDSNDVATCSWLISGNATQLVGPLYFRITLKCVTDGIIDYSWSTKIFKGLAVSSGINTTEFIAEEYADILSGWEARITALEQGGASVELDTTLTKPGQAADAKAVGDALAGKQPKGDYLTQNELPDMTAYRTAEAQNVIDAGKQNTLIQSGATVGQIAKITAVDNTGKPTAWETVDMPSGGGHWETVLDTVWQQDVINPTAYDAETGIFTCAAGELDNLELNTEYAFFSQCTKEGIAYNTILDNENLKLTKLSDTTFSIDLAPPTTFVVENVKFSRGACLVITDIDAKKIRLTLDGKFNPTATLYDSPFYGMGDPYFGRNTGYTQIRNAYQAYQQVIAEVESPYRIVGEILCGFNAPSQNASFHFKNNSFCSPLIPYDVPEGNERKYFLTSDGTKIAKLYSTRTPWHIGSVRDIQAILNDYLKIISGTKVKLERWVE